MEISNLRQTHGWGGDWSGGWTLLLKIGEKVLRKGEMYKELEHSADRVPVGTQSLPEPHLSMLPVTPCCKSDQLAARACRVLLESWSSAPPPHCPHCFFPGSSFAFYSLSFPHVGLVSGPDPVQYLSPGSAICSHFHMFNIHIRCLLPYPMAVTASFSLSLSPRATGHPSFCCFTLIPPGEYWGPAA